jgi:hypothetical protein
MLRFEKFLRRKSNMGVTLMGPGESQRLQMRRKLGLFEHLLWLVDQWTPRHFVLVARVEGGSMRAEDMRLALLHAQHRHPILRVSFLINGGNPEFHPIDAPIELRIVQRTSDTQWLHEAETQLALPFERNNQPLLRVVLVQGEALSELVLVVHHSIGDGASAMFLLRDLLECMEGNPLEELLPRNALEELLGSGETSVTGPPSSPVSQVVKRIERPQKGILQIFEVGPSELSRILDRSRRESTTFQGALLASLLLSMPEEDAVQCLAPINLRRIIPPVAEDFGLYISSGLATLDRNAAMDFWSLARTARAQVMQAFDRIALQAKAAAMASVVAAKLSPQTVYEKVWRSGSYNAVLTNLGRFPDTPKLRRFRVTAVYPILSPELEPVITVATVAQRAYITVSSHPSIADISSRFLELLKRQTH